MELLYIKRKYCFHLKCSFYLTPFIWQLESLCSFAFYFKLNKMSVSIFYHWSFRIFWLYEKQRCFKHSLIWRVWDRDWRIFSAFRDASNPSTDLKSPKSSKPELRVFTWLCRHDNGRNLNSPHSLLFVKNHPHRCCKSLFFEHICGKPLSQCFRGNGWLTSECSCC